MSTVNVSMWRQLVKSRPLYALVVKSLHQKPMSFYELSRGQSRGAYSSATHAVLKELLEMGIIEVASEHEMKNGQTKRLYKLTEVGRGLALE